MFTKHIFVLITLGFIFGACSMLPPVNPNTASITTIREQKSHQEWAIPHLERVESEIGVISYWGTEPELYNQLPEGSLALINPESGIFIGQTTTLTTNLAAYQTIVEQQDARDVSLLGYVPTGNFNHTCDIANKCQTWSRIDAQVKAYFENLPGLQGIFFDEATPTNWDCQAYKTEYQQLRKIVNHHNPDAIVAFNPGIADTCVIDAMNEDEIVVLFENDQTAYFAQAQSISDASIAAQDKGVLIWHLIHSVKTDTDMNLVVQEAKNRGRIMCMSPILVAIGKRVKTPGVRCRPTGNKR